MPNDSGHITYPSRVFLGLSPQPAFTLDQPYSRGGCSTEQRDKRMRFPKQGRFVACKKDLLTLAKERLEPDTGGHTSKHSGHKTPMPAAADRTISVNSASVELRLTVLCVEHQRVQSMIFPRKRPRLR